MKTTKNKSETLGDFEVDLEGMDETIDSLSVSPEEIIRMGARKLAIMALVDRSWSMENCIPELNEAINLFIASIGELDETKYVVELGVIAFNDNVELIEPIGAIDDMYIGEFEAEGYTSMGAAIEMGIKYLEERRKVYKENGQSFYVPWLCLFTDGQPTDDTTNAIAKCKKLQRARKLVVMPFGIGDNYDGDTLKEIGDGKYYDIDLAKEDSIKEAFRFLRDSAKRVSESAPGDEVDLDKGLSDKKGVTSVE